MRICYSGIESKLFGAEIAIKVDDKHPLILLANQLPWEKIMLLVEEDLKNSTKRKFLHLGRPLKVRIHLGAYCCKRCMI